MRQLFACLAALGLLGGVVGCCEIHCIHGRCDCDDSYGCACCPVHAGFAPHTYGPPDGVPLAGPGYVSSTPVDSTASTTVQK